MPPLENKLKVKVLSDLRRLPSCWAVKIQQTSIVGTPDILACVGGYFVALELKRTAKDNPSPSQTYQINKIDDAGGHAFVVCPDSWPACLAFLAQLARFHARALRLPPSA